MVHRILSHQQILHKINRIAYQIYESNVDEKEIVLAGIEGGGLDFARKIRLDGHIKQPESIIGFAAEGSDISLERCQLSGMQHVIKDKPEPEVVREAILTVLSTLG